MTLPPLALNSWLRWDVVQRLLPAGARSVLEVGCGQGGFGARLSTGRTYLGVDPDAESAQTARQRLAGRGEVRTGRVEDVVEAGRTFDLVCAFEVLEHLEDDVAALRHWVGYVRPGGWLLVSTPAFQRRYGAWDEIVGHYRRYEPEQLRELLEAHGFVDVEVVVFGAPLGFALEAARNAVGRRRLSRSTLPRTADPVPVDAASMEEMTRASGRLLQPTAAVAVLTRAGTAPFRIAQRRLPRSGTGLVARGRLPERPGADAGQPAPARP